MHIPVFRTTYKLSKVATAIDAICSYGLVFEILLVISIYRYFEKTSDWIIALAIFVVMLLLKFLIVPKYAEYVFKKRLGKMRESKETEIR